MNRKRIILLLFQCMIIGQESITVNDGKYNSVITRDEWGMPHVHGTTDEDAAFGLAYAHAQDDFKTIQDVLIASRGKLSEFYGVKLKSIKGLFNLLKGDISGLQGIQNVANDYYVNVIGIWDDLDKRYLNEVKTYIINDAKWKQAIKYCEERNWNWRIITEKEINIY